MDNCRTRDELTGTRSATAAAHKSTSSFQGTDPTIVLVCGDTVCTVDYTSW